MKQDNWKLLADLNISTTTVKFLSSQDYDIKRVSSLLKTDEEVVDLAQKEQRTILTFDKDFGEIYYFAKKKTFTVIVLALQNQTSEYVNKVLKDFLESISCDEMKNKLIILSEGRYRVIS